MKLTVEQQKKLAASYVAVLVRCAHFGSEPPAVSDHLQGFFDRGDYVDDDIEAVEELLITADITVTWPEAAALAPAAAEDTP